MNVSYFIASKIIRQKQQSFSALIIKVSTIATALSLAVMIVATAMVSGFQQVIRNKAFNLWGHIQITEYAENHSYENTAIKLSAEKLKAVQQLPTVKSIQAFAIKPGIIKKGEQIEGIVLKGISSDFDNSFFKAYLKTDKAPDTKTLFHFKDSTASNQIIVSQKIANRLHLKVDDYCMVYFIDKAPKARKLQIAAIYGTGLEEFDKVYAFVDLKLVQKLNKWQNNEVGGYEVFTKDVKNVDTVCNYINSDILPLNCNAQTIYQMFPSLFDWLNLQNMTEVIIIILILVVALINVISGLLILILERTQMIGILKTMGMNSGGLRRIFLYQASNIIMKGMLWGNVIGLGICAIQYYGKVIKLPEETYYISEVAIHVNWWMILVLNIGFMLISLISLMLPAIVINYIRPIKAIRFE